MKGKSDSKRRFDEPVVPQYDHRQPPPPALRQRLQQLGPEAFCQWILRQKKLLITDTTMRDAHQSLLATRMRAVFVLAAGALASPHLVLASGLERQSPAPAAVGRYLMRHWNAVVAGVLAVLLNQRMRGERVFRKGGACHGDVLMLSKPIGTGLTLAGGSADEKSAAIAGMRRLNRAASVPRRPRSERASD